MKEELKEIEGYNGAYLISNFGNVYSRHGKELTKLKQHLTRKGYARVSLSKKNKNTHYRVHRLVMIYFKPTLDVNLEVNHIDGDKLNNHVDNLEWCTWRQNYHHAVLVIEKIIPKKGSELERYIELKNKLFYSY